MLKRTRRRGVRILLGLAVASTLAAGFGVATAAAAQGGPRGNSAARKAGLGAGWEALPLADLSEEEIEGLLFMVEEEKLARDVYQTLFDLWGHPTFENIARSEQAHVDALKGLLDRYDLEVPVEDEAAGAFANTELQELYDSLVDQGSESLVSALHVGALIEEIDILDLEGYIDGTDAADLIRVYENLLRGSRNHLRAFSSAVERQTGEAHQPQMMEAEAYEDVVQAAMETGGWGRRAARDVQGAERGQGLRGGRGARGNGAGARLAQPGSGECLR